MKKVNSENATVEETPTANQPVNSTQPESATIEALIARLDKIEKENAELKSKNPLISIQERNKKYEGPRTYSYRIFRGNPVSDLYLVKQEVYTNQNTGRTIIDQVAKVTFSDDSSVEVNLLDFSSNYLMSEKQVAKEIVKQGNDTFYVFDTPEGTIKVKERVIN